MSDSAEPGLPLGSLGSAQDPEVMEAVVAEVLGRVRADAFAVDSDGLDGSVVGALHEYRWWTAAASAAAVLIAVLAAPSPFEEAPQFERAVYVAVLGLAERGALLQMGLTPSTGGESRPSDLTAIVLSLQDSWTPRSLDEHQ